MNYPTYELDLLVHRFPTRDGRHFTSEELADEAGGGYVHKKRNMANA